MVVSTDVDPKSLIKSITAAVNSVDPELPLAGVKTVDELVDESLAIDRFSVVLFSSFGLVGLLLAAVGIYGVMSFGSCATHTGIWHTHGARVRSDRELSGRF